MHLLRRDWQKSDMAKRKASRKYTEPREANVRKPHLRIVYFNSRSAGSLLESCDCARDPGKAAKQCARPCQWAPSANQLSTNSQPAPRPPLSGVAIKVARRRIEFTHRVTFSARFYSPVLALSTLAFSRARNQMEWLPASSHHGVASCVVFLFFFFSV